MAPVTKDFDQVTTLIELYFMFDLLKFDIDKVLGSPESDLYFTCISCPDCDL